MRRIGRIAALASAPLAVVAVALAATGALYLLRGHVPAAGPSVRDALPLDELPRHDGVPLYLFVGVWAVAGLLLGGLARSLRAERLTAAILLALGVGVWTYLVTDLSLLAVRQVPAESAFRAAGQLAAVYLPALLAGLGGAVLGRRRQAARDTRAPLLLAAGVAAAGVLAVLDAILPQHSTTLLARLAPGSHPIASALGAPIGLGLLLAARGLARRRRRAWDVAVVLLGSSTVLHLLHSDYGASLTGLLLLALLARRHDFGSPGDPAGPPRVLARAVLVLVLAYGLGGLMLWTNRLAADQPFTVGFALRQTTRAAVGLDLRGAPHLSASFGDWFGLSILIVTTGGLACAVAAWLAPWRYRLRHEAKERELVGRLVADWGRDTLAPFALRVDKSYFFDPDHRAFLAYRVVGGVAVVSGDPVGPAEAFDAVLSDFLAFAHTRGWRIGVLGASEERLPLYRRHGLRALYHGDEAVLEVDGFSLEGRAVRKLRQSVTRLARDGYTVEVRLAGEIDAALRRELTAIAETWRGDEPERGFAMALDGLFRLDDAVFVIGRAADGVPAGFLHFVVSHPSASLSLSSMPRLRETPNGFNEWLVSETVTWAREHGLRHISLNFSPFAAVLEPGAELSRSQRVERRALLALKGHFQLDNLLTFNRKFSPRRQRRFVVYEHRRDLPLVGFAALAAEGYLPFSRRAA